MKVHAGGARLLKFSEWGGQNVVASDRRGLLRSGLECAVGPALCGLVGTHHEGIDGMGTSRRGVRIR